MMLKFSSFMGNWREREGDRDGLVDSWLAVLIDIVDLSMKIEKFIQIYVYIYIYYIKKSKFLKNSILH